MSKEFKEFLNYQSEKNKEKRINLYYTRKLKERESHFINLYDSIAQIIQWEKFIEEEKEKHKKESSDTELQKNLSETLEILLKIEKRDNKIVKTYHKLIKKQT